MITMIKELGLNQVSGKQLSFNNYNDIFASLEILYSSIKKKVQRQ